MQAISACGFPRIRRNTLATSDAAPYRITARELAANPETRVKYAKSVLYDAAEAAELDEPGATAALINLKLSANAQFQDKAGACKLIETAAGRGDQSMARRMPECRAK
jgi:hypothetical protein